MDCHIVTWTYRGQHRLIDFDDEGVACRFARGLTESDDREDVRVTTVDYAPDEGAKQRIAARIAERTRIEGVFS